MASPRPLVLAVLLAAVAAAALAGPAGARPKASHAHYPSVGFGEQRSTVFSNPLWRDLGLRRVRVIAGWDALRYGWQRRELDAWMAAAREAGARPLLALTRSRHPDRTRVLPRARRYRKAFKAFRKRYPDVREYLVWNEANHCSQPLCHRPRRAARYFDVMSSACPACTIVALDVLDTPSMPGYVRAFKRAARHRPRVWGLHNYVDANRMQTTGTRTFLRLTRGRVWFTETGGLVERRTTSPIEFPQSVSHAGRAVRFVLHRLARLSPRVKRIYLYHFQHQGPDATWDSGVLNEHGKPRVAYRVVARWAAKAKAARRARRTR